MRTNLFAAAWLLVMVALIVGVDVAFLRDHFWLRLLVNAGIVAVFAVIYLTLFRGRPAQLS